MESSYHSSFLARSATTLEKNAITFNVELFCTETKATKYTTISFPEDEAPTTIANLKFKVEEKFNIPLCIQNLTYETHQLRDDTNLEITMIRSGDTFRIEYLAEGQCEEIMDVVTWFVKVRDFLLLEDPVLYRISTDFDDLLIVGINEEFIENLAFKYLFPWLDACKYANKLYFVQCGGLNVVMDIFVALHRRPWKECALKLKYVEYGILRILWNLSETFALRRQIIACNNGLQLCIKSLLREKVTEGKKIEDYTECQNHRDNSWVLVENIGAALGLLCNLSELSECHLEIASNQECLEQLSCISLCPSVRIMSVQLVATLFLCIAYTPDTHPFLAQPFVIKRLLSACAKERVFTDDDDDNDKRRDMLMLRYFTQVYLAQIILVSPQHISEDFQQQIFNFMDDFLKVATYRDIMDGEVKHWYVWSTFIPYIKLAYLPSHMHHPPNTMMKQLHMLSLQTALLSLQNMLGRDNHKEVLRKEGLEDYITCIPSYVPEPLQTEARTLVHIVGSGIPLQPPKLINLVKAKLAVMHFGLERVLKMTVGEIINEILPYQ